MNIYFILDFLLYLIYGFLYFIFLRATLRVQNLLRVPSLLFSLVRFAAETFEGSGVKSLGVSPSDV